MRELMLRGHEIGRISLFSFLYGNGINSLMWRKCIFLEVPYYKNVREMIKLLKKTLSWSHFLIKEGLS